MSNKKWIYNGVEFKVGDTVKVVRATPNHAPNGMGEGVEWQNSWNHGLDDEIGQEYEIYGIDVTGCWLNGSLFGYPLSSLKKVMSAAEEDFVDSDWVEVECWEPLPSGDFQLVDKRGVEYAVWDSECGTYSLNWKLQIAGAPTCAVCLSATNIREGIKSGFWKVSKTAEQLAKEARVANLKIQHKSLLARHDILINEINELEEQIDKEYL